MKRLELLLMLFLLLIPVAGQAGQFGPIRPAAKAGQISQEIGYFWSQGDWIADEGEEDGFAFEDGTITMNQVYVQAGYGVGHDWEAYFRVGGADFQFENAFAIDDTSMEDGIQPFVTVGAKGVFYHGPYFDLGAFAQGTYYSGYEDSTTAEISPGVTAREELEFEDFWDVNLGLALQANLNGLALYAGPVFYYSQVKLETETTIPSVGAESNSSDYGERDNIGAVAGINVPLPGYGSLCFEGQYKGKLSAGGAFVYLRLNR